MLTYANVCGRMRTYADVCGDNSKKNQQEPEFDHAYSYVSKIKQARTIRSYAHVCSRMLTCADVC
jgi:hypothetical protein